MSQRVSLSVLIPAHNAAEFLPRAIETIRAQSVQPDEIIIVDDESTDNTAEVAQGLGARVLRQARGGAARARNAGLGIAKNDWIATLDADDLWHPSKLQMQLDAISSEAGLGLVFADFDAVSATDGRIHRHSVVSNDARFSNIKRKRLTPEADLLDFTEFLRELAARPFIQPSTAVFRRDLAIAIGGFTLNIGAEDTDFFLRLTSRTKTGFVNVPLVAYMQHSSQLTANRDLDAVRLELHDHVMAHESDYSDLIPRVFKKEYAKVLYCCAAQAASKKRFLTAVGLLAKAAAAAGCSGQLPTLVRAAMQSRIVARGRLAATATSPQGSEMNKPTVRGVEIPWRRSGVYDCQLSA